MKFQSTDASLAEEIPYWEFLSDPIPHLSLSDGSLVAGLNVQLIDVECFDNGDINRFALALRSCLNSIPEGLSIQFCLSIRSDYQDVVDGHARLRQKSVHPIIESMSSARVEALSEAIRDHALYRPRLKVFLRVPPAQKKRGGFFNTEEEFKELVDSEYEDSLSQLTDSLDGLAQGLTALGIEVARMSSADQLELVYRTMNPQRSKAHPTPNLLGNGDRIDPSVLKESPWLGDPSHREQLTFGDLVIAHDHFMLDSEVHKVITLKNLPEVTIAGQLAEILRLPFHYDLILSFHVPAQNSEMAALERRRRMAHSLASNPGGGVSDLESESKLSSTEELIRELLNTGQRIYASQLQFVIRSSADVTGLKVLARRSREILNRLRSLQGAEGLEESVGAWKVFKGTLPGAPLHLERAKKMKTNNLADFLPVYGPSQGDKLPVVVFRNRLNGLFSFDAFDSKLPNYNMLVTGSSGAGKSF